MWFFFRYRNAIRRIMIKSFLIWCFCLLPSLYPVYNSAVRFSLFSYKIDIYSGRLKTGEPAKTRPYKNLPMNLFSPTTTRYLVASCRALLSTRTVWIWPPIFPMEWEWKSSQLDENNRYHTRNWAKHLLKHLSFAQKSEQLQPLKVSGVNSLFWVESNLSILM